MKNVFKIGIGLVATAAVYYGLKEYYVDKLAKLYAANGPISDGSRMITREEQIKSEKKGLRKYNLFKLIKDVPSAKSFAEAELSRGDAIS